MVTSALKQSLRIPSHGSDRQPSEETSSSGEESVQVHARNVTEPESRIDEDLRLKGGVLILGTIRNLFDRRGLSLHELEQRRQIALSLWNEVNAGLYPITDEIRNSVPVEQRDAASVARAILEIIGWQAAAEREYVKRDIAQRLAQAEAR
jgi:hypothetical protein